MHAAHNEEFQCHKCVSKYKGHPSAELMSKRYREQKGCFGVGDRITQRMAEKDWNMEYRTCIGNVYAPVAMTYYEMHTQYEKGNLPFPGSLGDQPAKIMDIFRVINHYKADKMEKELKKQRQDALRKKYSGKHY